MNRTVAEASVAAEAYLDFTKWSLGIAVMAGRDPRSVPGVDAISELRRRLGNWDLPVPLPAAQ